MTIGRVAKVHPAPMIRAGLATRDGEGEIVTGLVMMLIGQNGRKVVTKVKAEIAELQKSLPPGVTIEPLYDRTHLINLTLNTVLHNLVAGGLLVIVVLLAMLGNLRGGLIVALAIPLSYAVRGQHHARHRPVGQPDELGRDRLRPDRRLQRDHASRIACGGWPTRAEPGPRRTSSATPPSRSASQACSADLIIAIVYFPILALQGTEGKMFRPMALTVIFALAGSLVLSLTRSCR